MLLKKRYKSKDQVLEFCRVAERVGALVPIGTRLIIDDEFIDAITDIEGPDRSLSQTVCESISQDIFLLGEILNEWNGRAFTSTMIVKRLSSPRRRFVESSLERLLLMGFVSKNHEGYTLLPVEELPDTKEIINIHRQAH